MSGEMPSLRFVYRFGKKTYDLTSRTHIMGILNVTPDSFSDGGRYFTRSSAVERALSMAEEGADIIDVGGESTRPRSAAYGEGAQAVSAQEEIDRVLPVVEEFVKCSDVPVSIDTYKATVAAHALSAGASIVNDISGFAFDPAMASTVAAANASAVVMHIKGTPGTMQANPTYADLFGEILSYLRTAVRKGEDCGIRQMIVDPGIGFGKTPAHNYSLLAGVGRFASLGYPLMVGPSRKSFLAAAIDLPVEERMEASLAAATAAVISGAHLLRVHDVRATKRAVAVADAIRSARH